MRLFFTRKEQTRKKKLASEVYELKDAARNDTSRISVEIEEETTTMTGTDNVMPLIPVFSMDFYSRDSE